MRHESRKAVLLLLLLVAAASPVRAQQSGPVAPAPAASRPAPQRFVYQGIAVEFTSDPDAAGGESSVRFRITDGGTGQPLTGLRPLAWLTRAESGATADERQCRGKVRSFLQASFGARAEVDLNTFFILALNDEPNISVIDALTGFGGSKLYTLIPLNSPGEDWVLSADRRRLFVTMPRAGQLAVVDTAAWKVVANVEAGARPARVALQRDGKYLWVSNETEGAAGGVSVIDAATLKLVKRFQTGGGRQDIAFGTDDRYAFVSNRQAGTLTVIDVAGLSVVKELKTGALPSALAFSPVSRAVYVVHEGDGAIVAIDEKSHAVRARVLAAPGLSSVRFPPGERFGFVLNRAAGVVYVIDGSTNRLVHAVAVGPEPDQITFTRDYAYVRTRGDEFVSMISLASVGREGVAPLTNRFPAGQKAPALSPHASPASAVAPSPEPGSMLVANPSDKMIYYYTEGMAAPMGSFQNYRREPRALLVWDRGLREAAPGVYSTNFRLPRGGDYDVAFLLDSPRVVNCFRLSAGDAAAVAERGRVALRIEPMFAERAVAAGEAFRLRFKVSDAATNQPKSDLRDLGVLAFLAPGLWQHRAWATPLGGGLYETTLTPPQPGVYYVHFQSPSLGLRFNELPTLTFRADAPAARP